MASAKEQVIEGFRALDPHGSGTVPRAVLEDVLRDVCRGSPEWLESLDFALARAGDADVDYEEFFAWVFSGPAGSASQERQKAAAGTSTPSPSAGQKIKVSGRLGVVRFQGPMDSKDGEWIGVEMDEPVGNNNGTTAEKSYFSCLDKHGIFVRPQDIVTAVDDQEALEQLPHMPELEEVPVPEEKQALWERCGGTELDTVLGRGSVVLLSSEWMAERAESGGALRPRQALPEVAFLPKSRVQAATVNAGFGDCNQFLKIACISHCWLQADHPDPRGHNLRIMGRVFRLLASDGKYMFHGCWSVFFDLCCIHQNCRDREGVPQQHTYQRLPDSDLFEEGAIGKFNSEADYFKEALGSLGSFYSHPKTFVFMLTQFPADYDDPAAYVRSGNTEQYFNRGWCFCESSWAMLVKDSIMLLDLGKSRGEEDCYFGGFNNPSSLVTSCSAGRKAPVLPEAFVEELQTKGFTNGKDDRPRVADLYGSAFTQRFQSAEGLHYDSLGWGDQEIQQVAAVLASGAAPRLWKLNLSGNRVGDAGAARLAEALRAPGALPVLEQLDLRGNRVGEEGAARLAEALWAPGAAPQLRLLQLVGQKPPLGGAGRAALEAALRRGGFLAL